MKPRRHNPIAAAPPDTRPIAAVPPAVCPTCGGVLEIVADGMIGKLYAPAVHVRGEPLRRVLVLAPFAACSQCEFCVEIRL